ncbi:SWIM zinc finger family protein [Gordonia sinesedis]
MSRWTPKQVADVAPDPASLTAARKLAKPGPWSETGSTDTLLWGKCQGSGKTPYQVSIDLIRPAYRCSCPSRKFPCKHALALLMLWSESDGAIADTAEAADFAAEWADAARPKARRPAESGPADPAAAARRLEDRLVLMSRGIEDFALWLTDLVRNGLAAARNQPASWWEDTGARLVDAQLPGLADQVRAMGSSVHAREDWATHLLGTAGRWWTATHAWRRRDELDAASFGDLRRELGWSWSSEEIAATGTTAGIWQVLGAHRTDDGRLQQQRTWLRNEHTGEKAHLLDFAARGGSLPVSQLAGARLAATVATYPGHGPRRLLLAAPAEVLEPADRLPDGGTIQAALGDRAETLAANPWTHRIPVTLAAATLTTDHVVDVDGTGLPLVRDADPWVALALTGGAPAAIFGELDDHGFRPLTLGLDGRVVAL